MTDSITNGARHETLSPSLPAPDDLAELRHLLLGQEQSQLGHLQERLDNPVLHAHEVSDVLAEAIFLRARQDDKLAKSLMPIVEDAIQTSVQKNPQVLVEALFPTIGPAIRKAIASVLRSMLESLNHSLELSISLRGLRWRIEGWRTGKSFAEVVLLHTLRYQVEQVFLIHKTTGLLLQHVAAWSVATQDEAMISGMLTAIQDFVRDAFLGGQRSATLDTVQVGDLTVWIEQGPQAVLAVVIRGTAAQELRPVLQDVIEQIHLEYHEALAAFKGDSEPFAATRTHLESCLQMQYHLREQRTSPVLWIAVAAILITLGIWSFFTIRTQQRWTRYLERLRAEPGIVLTSAEKQGKTYVVAGLRDPLAADPLQFLQAVSLPVERVVSRWEPYHAFHPAFVLARAQAVLAPPEMVTLYFDSGVLQATGTAPHQWIVDAQRLARAIPGVTQWQTDSLVDSTLERLAALKRQIEQVNLRFAKNTSQLLSGQGETLRALGQALYTLSLVAQSVGQSMRLELMGQADDTGSDEKNAKLSQERAEYVRVALLAQGLPGIYFTTVGLGAREALSQGHEGTEQERATFRKVSGRVILSTVSGK